jgi:opine dehydrogenase
MKTSRVCVIGNGALSLSIAGQLAGSGALVTYLDLSEHGDAHAVLKDDPVLRFTGALEMDVRLSAVTRDVAAIAGSDIIAVTVTASYYDKFFPAMVPLLHDGQHVVFFPACFGAQLLSRNIPKAQAAGLTIAEAVSFPCVCDWDKCRTINVHSVKRALRMSVYPKSRLEETLHLYNDCFRIFEPARNFLETSLDNMNLTLHPLPVLLNAGGVERDPNGFRHFIDGFTPTVGALVEQLDAERLAVGKAYGLDLVSTLDQLKTYYGDSSATSIGAYVTARGGPYTNVRGFGLTSRYVTEDIPYLVVPTLALAGAAGVATPLLELCLRLANAVMRTDYAAAGLSLDRLGLSHMSVQDLLRAVEGQPPDIL